MEKVNKMLLLSCALAGSLSASSPMDILSGHTHKKIGISVPVAATGSFIQKVKTPGGRTVKYSGNLSINRTREFKMEYLAPSRRDICGDGSSVAIVDHRLEQASFFKTGSLLDLMQILKRAEHRHDSIYASKYHGTEYTIKLDKLKKLEQVAFVDDQENTVNIHFYNMRYLNTKLSAQKLECPIPKSYDIIDQ